MVRYTQDSWTNNAPSIQQNLWGDDPFPAVDSNWDQPGKSFVVSLNQTIGTNAINSLQFSYSANKIDDHPRRPGRPSSTRKSPAGCRRSFPTAVKQYGDRRAIPCSGAAAVIRRPLERSAVPQQPGPVHHQGRLHAGFGKHMRQGRRPRQL